MTSLSSGRSLRRMSASSYRLGKMVRFVCGNLGKAAHVGQLGRKMTTTLATISALIILVNSSDVAITSRVTYAINCPSQESAQQTARRIWEQAIAAKGGRERLYAVQNLVISTVGKLHDKFWQDEYGTHRGVLCLPKQGMVVGVL